MRGETVIVKTREKVGVDDFNNPVFDYVDARVDDVLVAIGSQGDVIDSNRPDGVSVKYTLYFPKTFENDILERSEVEVRGECLRVIGMPDRWNNCPTRWNMVCEVGVTNG